MRALKLFLILPMILIALPAHAADEESRPENVEAQKVQSPSDRAERPKREAVKLSPTIRVSPLLSDESHKIRGATPARVNSPLLNMPAPKDMPSPQGSETPGAR